MATSSVNVVAACAAAAAVACAGGAALVAANSATTPMTLFAPAVSAPPPLSFPDAVRLSKQATFGPTVVLVNHMVQLDLGPWLDEQFAAKESSYSDLMARRVLNDVCSTLTGTDYNTCWRDNFSVTPVAMEFYANAVNRNDQLRQRTALALSELMVASDLSVHTTAGLAAFNQLFLDNAFGNYRDILKAVTLNPYMGTYLNLAGSNKSAPNENYAREMMQLFAVGVNQLNMDGALVRDAAGAPIATYTPTDVHEIARAVTGWTYAHLDPKSTAYNDIDYTKPMIPAASGYDTSAKTFLGRTVAANTAQTASLDAVIDAVFNQPSVAPYVAKNLIQQLVVANPSPAYVGRVAAVFADNGQGVRGDMKAVIRAILTDAEARSPADPAAQGKVKEPILMAVGLARVVGMSTDGYGFVARMAATGQEVFRAPSVFNFYPPDYPLPLGAPLLSPASKLMTTGTIIARHNIAYDWTLGADTPTSRWEFQVQPTIAGATGTQVRWSDWEVFGTNTDAMLERINLLMTDNGLTAAQLAAIKTAMLAQTSTDPAAQARHRAQTALYIAAASPLFQTDR